MRTDRRPYRIAGLFAFAAAIALLLATDPDAPGTWLERYAGSLALASGVAAPFAVVLWFRGRPQPDGMPRELWTGEAVTGAGERFHVVAWHRRLSRAAMAAAVPVGVAMLLMALDWGTAPVVFVVLWACLTAYGIGSWATRSVEGATVAADGTLLVDAPRRQVAIPAGEVTAIREAWNGLVTIEHRGGRVVLYGPVRGLDRLLAEVRRHNPALVYEGRWPPQRSRS